MTYTLWRGGEQLGEVIAEFPGQPHNIVLGLFKPTAAFADIEPLMQVRIAIPGRGRPVFLHRLPSGPAPSVAAAPLTALTPAEALGLPVDEQLLVRDAAGELADVAQLHLLQEPVPTGSGDFPDFCRAHGFKDSVWQLALRLES